MADPSHTAPPEDSINAECPQWANHVTERSWREGKGMGGALGMTASGVF